MAEDAPVNPSRTAVFQKNADNNAAIIESKIIWSEKLRALTDRGLETLTTNTSSVPGLQITDNWGRLSYDDRESQVAQAIVNEIQENGGDFYQVDDAANPILDATAHVKSPLRKRHRATIWKDYVETHRDIGIITMFFFHSNKDKNWKWSCFLCKFFLFLILAIQFIVPIVVAFSKWTDYKHVYYDQGFHKGFCPKGADRVDQTLACAVAVIYFSKLSFLLMQRFVEVDHSLLTTTSKGGILLRTVICDRFMFFVYEPAVYLINLWIIFLEPDTYSIVFSALAMEFILDLDDLFKAMFIKIFPPDIDKYRERNDDISEGAPRKRMYQLFWVLEYFWIFLCICCCLIAFFGIGYLPACKPSVT